MTYTWATWLATALRAEGCHVIEESGWTTRGRPSSTGSFSPYGVALHHTGTTTSASNPAPTLRTCIEGRSDLPGPLCHVLIGYDGACHVIAAGRANHAGTNKGSGPIPAGDGNSQMIGFELDYSGSQPVSDAQGTAAILASAAVLRHMGRSADYCRGHKETSDSGKWDPGRYGSSSPYYLMSNARALVADQLAGADMPLTDDDIRRIWTWNLGDPPTSVGTIMVRVNPGPYGFAQAVINAVWGHMTTSAFDGTKQTTLTLLRWAQANAKMASDALAGMTSGAHSHPPQPEGESSREGTEGRDG